MRQIETSLQQFGEFLLRARLVREKAAPGSSVSPPLMPAGPASKGATDPGRALPHSPVFGPLRLSTSRNHCALNRQCRNWQAKEFVFGLFTKSWLAT